MTKIEWANETWNPITGCDPISEGCENCYAARMAKRLAGRYGYPKDPFRVTFHQDKLHQPIYWARSRKIFVCSMGDLFHEEVPVEWIDSVFRMMAIASHHTFLVLTKRPHLMKIYFEKFATDYLRKNIWLGVTVENQSRAEQRIAVLLGIPAAKYFVSVEPMLGEVRLDNISFPDGDEVNVLTGREEFQRWGGRRLDWVICGAETGPRKRPMQNAWAESLRDQCESARVPFFFKKDNTGEGSLNGKTYHDYPLE